MQTISIIGGNGFIGKNLTKYFATNKYNVLVNDNNINISQENLRNVSFHFVDIHHTNELIEITTKADHIVWLAHASIPATTDESLVDDFSLNISPVIKFLEKSSKLFYKKFIYFSSGGAIYGDVNGKSPVNENNLQKPVSDYGLSKSVVEKYIEYLTRKSNHESIILRPSNIYGPYQNMAKPQGIIGYAFKAIRDEIPLVLYNNGQMVRDFIFVEDVAKAVEKCICAPITKGKTNFYNVGSNEGFSIKQILEKVENITERKLKIDNKDSRNFDCEYNVLNVEKIKKTLNWSKETDLDTGLRKVWEWIQLEK